MRRMVTTTLALWKMFKNLEKAIQNKMDQTDQSDMIGFVFMLGVVATLVVGIPIILGYEIIGLLFLIPFIWLGKLVYA